jgi:uncharacterized GH25 family protein
MRKALLAGVIVGLLSLTALPQQNGRKSAQLNFVVVKDGNGKPVRNAEIVLHPLDKTGKQKQEGLELKTHEDGTATVAGIPYGKLRIQVIARGLRTYGQDYDIDQPTHEITIKMQKPSEQYSIYK